MGQILLGQKIDVSSFKTWINRKKNGKALHLDFLLLFLDFRKSSLPIQKKTYIILSLAYFKYCIVCIFKYHFMIKRRFEGVKTSRIFVTVTLFFSSALKPYLLRICLRCKGQLISKTKFKVFI